MVHSLHIQRHCCASVKDLGFQWPGSTRYRLEEGVERAFYAHASTGKLTALKVLQIEYEASTAGRTGFSSDSAQNLLRGNSASIKHCSLLDYVCLQTGLTPLMAAVTNSHFAVAHQLLAYGSKVDVTGPKSRTALHLLLKKSSVVDLKMLNLLLDAGANPFLADDSGVTALEYALRQRSHRFACIPGGFEQVLQSLLDHSICAGPAEVKVSRAFGLSRPWVKRYCALVPHVSASRQQPQLQLLLLDEKSLTLVERLTVQDCTKAHYVPNEALRTRLTMQQDQRQQPRCAFGRDPDGKTVQLRAVGDGSEQNVVMNQLTELAEMHPESVQFWLQGRSNRQAVTPPQTIQEDTAVTSRGLSPPGMQRTDSCRHWSSFRRCKHSTARRSASLGIVDSSSRDIMMTQPPPEQGSSIPHGVLDSADSLFDTLAFHFHGL